MLQLLTETMASGHGSRPNDDVEKVTRGPCSTRNLRATNPKVAVVVVIDTDLNQRPRKLGDVGRRRVLPGSRSVAVRGPVGERRPRSGGTFVVQPQYGARRHRNWAGSS